MNILQILTKSINTIYVKYMDKNIENIGEIPIFYIGGSQTLPPPLEPDEEEKILEQLSLRRWKCKENISWKKFKVSSIYSEKIWKYRDRNRGFNIYRDNWLNESYKYF